jgi:EpsD family peptidyl-prolyl cis-trans isomerase
MTRTFTSVSSLVRVLPAVAAALALAACNKTGTASTPSGAAAPAAASAASGAAAEVVAKVNGDDITGAQLDLAMRRRHAVRAAEADAPSRAALEGVIDQELEAQQALKLKLDQTPEVQQTLEMIRREFLAQAYMRHLAEELPKPGDDAIKAFYDSHAAMYADHKTYNLQRYEVMAPAEKHDAVVAKAAAVKSEAELDAWLKGQNIKFQKSPLKLESEQLQSPTGEKLKALKPGQAMGQASGPAVAVFVLESVQASPKALQDAHPQIEQQLGMEARRTALMGAAKALRKDAKIEYQGKFAEPPASAPAMGGSAPVINLAPAAPPASAASR